MLTNYNHTLLSYFSTVQYTAEQLGKFDLSIGLFKEDTFSTAFQTNDAIDVLNTIYAKLALRSSSGSLKMAVQSCIATPHNTPPDGATYTHNLINGRSVCPIFSIHSLNVCVHRTHFDLIYQRNCE